jgi:signal peptidase I
MMGDNRDDSSDSRVPGGVGYVPFENLIGRAQVIFFSVRAGDHAWEVWDWPWTVRWSRLLTLAR